MADDPTQPTPRGPDLAREVALSRLKSRLFGRDSAVKLGRYHLLEMVGRGGMGTVWGAWDPELERRVAIKLLTPSPDASGRVVQEGQALAKLSHPHVVPIYDVGVLDDQVYLVMEWVQGASLRAYVAAAPRSVREVVAVYRQAGEGLAAVHAAGLVHRDFKPDNAVRGEDGRVRVLDFGLALTAQGVAPRTAGTPRYMPPEQLAGEPVTAASDQFAFCVALREALVARAGRARTADLPRWLAAIIERGTQPDPAARFATLADLLRALARDPARVWRGRAALALAAVAIVAAFGVGRTRAGDAVDHCAGGAADIAQLLGPGQRHAVLRHLAELGPVGIEAAPGVVHDLDALASTWIGAHRAACQRYERGELTAPLYERRLGCLSRSRAALGAARELLAGVARDGLDSALVAARSLPDPARCADVDATRLTPPSPAVAARVDAVGRDIDRARVLAIAAHPEAVAIARGVVRDAEATRYPPVIAGALVVLGRAQMQVEDHAARAAFARAVGLAIAGGDDVLAVEAFARLAFVARFEREVVDGASLIEPLAERAGVAGRAARALLYNNLATVQLSRSDRAAARALLLRAQRELPADPATLDIELVVVPQNLAPLLPTAREREQVLHGVSQAFAHALGPVHPSTLEARAAEAQAIEDGARSRIALAAVCAEMQRARPELSLTAWCHAELGGLLDDLGDAPAARAAFAIATADPDRSAMGPIARFHADVLGDDPVAVRRAGDLARVLGLTLGATPEVWLRIYAHDADVVAARAAELRGDRPAAARAWRAAVDHLAGAEFPVLGRRLARARAGLAENLPPGPARDDARRIALAWYTAAGGYPARVAALASD